MMRACDVPQCSTRTNYRSIHYLPANEILKIKWIHALRVDIKKIAKVFRVCSSHFKAEDYLPTIFDQRRLKQGVVPTQNLPKSSIVSKVPAARTSPKERQQRNIIVESIEGNVFDAGNHEEVVSKDDSSPRHDAKNGHEPSVSEDPGTSDIEDLMIDLQIVDDVDDEKLSVDENNNFAAMEKRTLKRYADKCVQVNTLHNIKLSNPGFMDMLHTDGDLYSFTGLSGFDLLNRIVICMNHVESIRLKLEKLQIPLDVAIVLVLTKIKVNFTFKQCGVLFQLHPHTISRIFSNILPLLRAVLSLAVFWPTKEGNSRNIRTCFKPDFIHCRGVCDCTETEIQKLKSLTSRIKSFSHYKGKHTLKFQITINPFGLITHASSTYGGKASDKHIFLNEKLLEKFEEGDAVMVDKGYAIADEVSSKGITLIRPPILDQPQLSRDNAILNTNIARARIHVERSIQRVKVFKVFQEKIGVHMLQHMDDIVMVVCAIVNLSSPILAEDKF